jgi:acetolactate synthase I/II/III large subunit
VSGGSTTGGELLCRTLEALGARCVFGLPGTQNVELFEALRRSRLRTVLATSELAASFMANGWARASGEPGVLFTIPGPGFTWALPGLAEARLDSAPVLHVVGQPARGPGRRFQHQAIAQAEMAAPLVKRVVPVERVEELEAAVVLAWDATLEGEPGPVVLHLGPDVISGSVEPAERLPRAVAGDGAVPQQWPRLLRERVAAARRPLLLVGQGAADSAAAVRALAESLPAPVASTPSGRGVVPEHHAWSLAWEPLRGGVEPFNELVETCDLVLALGCKLSHNGSSGFRLRLPREILVHADPGAQVLEANYEASLAIQAPADVVLGHVGRAAADRERSTWTVDEVSAWRERLAGRGAPATEPRVHGLEPPTPAALFALLREHLPDDAIVVTDSGLHQYLVRRHFEVRSPRGLVTPADFQSMGFGLPAAIGAALACPGRRLVAVIGDGGLSMSAMELLTAARERIPLTLIVFNDGQLNLIRHQQVRDWGHTHAVRLRNPDMEVLAEALGVGYRRLDPDPVNALRESLDSEQPVLLEVRLGDSPSFRTLRGRSLARATGRRVLGPGLVAWLKRRLGRRD